MNLVAAERIDWARCSRRSQAIYVCCVYSVLVYWCALHSRLHFWNVIVFSNWSDIVWFVSNKIWDSYRRRTRLTLICVWMNKLARLLYAAPDRVGFAVNGIGEHWPLVLVSAVPTVVLRSCFVRWREGDTKQLTRMQSKNWTIYVKTRSFTFAPLYGGLSAFVRAHSLSGPIRWTGNVSLIFF